MEVVKVDKKGRLLIPKKIREKVGIKEGSLAKVELKEEGIVIKPMKPVAHKYFGAFKIKRWPEDLDEFTARAMKDWWSKKNYVDVNVFVYWLGGHATFGKAAC